MDLSDAYAVGAYIEGADSFPPLWAVSANNFREESGKRAQLDLPYGTGARHKLDLFMPKGPVKGVFVFVHGGYWMAFDKSSWSHLAKGMNTRGWAVAIPSYDLCPDVKINEITSQVSQAISHIARRVEGPITLAGHSAGGHLVARMLDRAVLDPEIGSRVKRVIPISPLGDLRPLVQTEMNSTLNLDLDSAAAESPVLMDDRYSADVIVWVGASERPSFLSQADGLSRVWDAQLVVEQGRHHFDVIDALSDPESDMILSLVS